MAGYIQNVGVPSLDLHTLWNDRRDPHANPLSSSPRREVARGNTSGLGKAVEGLFHPGVVGDDDRPSFALTNKRLYESGMASGGVERDSMGVGERERE